MRSIGAGSRGWFESGNGFGVGRSRWRGGIWLLVIFASVLSACVQLPTRVGETRDRRQDAALKNREDILPKVTPETVIVDARSLFDYSTAHVPRSVNLQWDDFSEPEPEQRGILQSDLFAITRRLARVGIAPNTPVVVVGRGFKGNAEEGRLAWMLAYLGVKNVRFADLDALKFRVTNLPEQNPMKSEAIWKPETQESMNVTRAELLFALNKRAMFNPHAFNPGEAPVLYRLIDVRSANAYLGKAGLGAKVKIPNMEAVNIPWMEFFWPSMGVRAEIAQKLEAVDILPEHRIIVLDEDGVASAAVTMALRSMGYARAGNLSGGLMDLMSAYPQVQ